MGEQKWTPQRVRMEGWPEKVCGIPALLVAERVEADGKFEWAIYDRRGRLADWLWNKMMEQPQERLRLEEVVRDKLIGWGPGAFLK